MMTFRRFEWAFAALALVVLGCSLSVSYSGLYGVSESMGVPAPIRAAVPIGIDVSLLMTTAGALIYKRRGWSIRWLRAGTAFWTAISCVGNVLHVMIANETMTPASWIAAGIASLMPIAVLTSSAILERILVEGRQAPARKAAAEKPALVREAAPAKPAPVAAAAPSRPHLVEAPAPAPAAVEAAPPAEPALEVDESELRARVAELTGQGLSQAKVAEALGLSRPKVQRLLKAIATESEAVAA